MVIKALEHENPVQGWQYEWQVNPCNGESSESSGERVLMAIVITDAVFQNALPEISSFEHVR